MTAFIEDTLEVLGDVFDCCIRTFCYFFGHHFGEGHYKCLRS